MEKEITVGGQKAYLYNKPERKGTFHCFDNLTFGDDSRKVQLYLPEGYEKSKDKYPVVYMNDGQTCFDCGGLSPWSWDVDETIDNLTAKKDIQKVIIAAIYPVNRAEEYLPKGNFHAQENGLGDGRLDEYSEYIVNSLKPFIEKNYRVESSPSKTAIVGASFGGVVAFYLPAIYPNDFGIGAVMSPSLSSVILFDKNEIYKYNTEYLNEIKRSLKVAKTKPTFWIDCGGQEGFITEQCPVVANMLKKEFGYKDSKNLFFVLDDFATHDERAWKYRFGLFMKTFYSSKKG